MPGKSKKGRSLEGHGYVRSVRLDAERVSSFTEYPFAIAAVRALQAGELDIDSKVTFLVGENGSGKSTLLEAIAVAVGFNAEGGSKNFRFATRSSESPLHEYLRVVRGITRPKDGFFLRAESYFNLGTEIEQLDGGRAGALIGAYGGRSLHEQSHGESFLALAQNRFFGNGLYLLDEPEAALSPNRQLALLGIMHDLVERRASQFIIATHSPILLAYPGARIYLLDAQGISPVRYEDTEHFQVTRDFLSAPERYFKHLFAGTADDGEA